jgi:hypothetical protein
MEDDALVYVSEIINNLGKLIELVKEKKNNTNVDNSTQTITECNNGYITIGDRIVPVVDEKAILDLSKQELPITMVDNSTSTDIVRIIEDEVPEHATETELTETQNNLMDSIATDYDYLINKRVEFHKQNGTYLGKASEEANPTTETTTSAQNNTGSKKIPMATPLSKLTKREMDNLLKRIFDKATFNIKTLESLNEMDPTFDNRVNQEADRLLALWNEKNKFT